MDEELMREAFRIYDERRLGSGRRGRLWGAMLRADDVEDYGTVFESLRSLVETIAILEARIERLEKQ